MSKKNKAKKSDHYWNEIFNEIDVEVIPAEYLHSVRVTFETGEIWDIDFQESESDYEVDESIAEIMDLYESSISHFDFQLDTEKVRDRISKRSRKLLKKRK